MAARRNTRGKKAEVQPVEIEEENGGGGLTLEDGMQIFTFVAMLGAILIMVMTLHPRYPDVV